MTALLLDSDDVAVGLHLGNVMAASVYGPRGERRELLTERMASVPNINEAFPSKYLKAADLKGRAVNVVIDRVDMEPVGQSREMKPVVYFEGKDKGFVLNKTCANKIMEMTKSPVTEEWAGQLVQLYPTETSFQGEQVDCIRVRAVSGQRTAAPLTPAPIADDFIDTEEPPF